jgi:uncharacterized protein (TIGR03000 family)
MPRLFQKFVLLVPAFLAFFDTGQLAAQTGWAQGTLYAPSPGNLDFHSTSPFYTTYGYNMNGFPPNYYAGYATGTLPTYMTSINYPWIYGAYGYQYAPGSFTYGAGQSSFTTAPTVYGVYVPPASSLTAYRVFPDTAMTPIQTTASVDVRLPADAELRFEGVPMMLRGTLRRFTTPALDPAGNYIYTVSATWTENGQEVTRNRQVGIRAGDRLTIDFTTPTNGETGTSTLRTRPLR